MPKQLWEARERERHITMTVTVLMTIDTTTLHGHGGLRTQASALKPGACDDGAREKVESDDVGSEAQHLCSKRADAKEGS